MQFAWSEEELSTVPAVPADDFFALHEYLDDLLGPGFAVRVGQQMKIDDYGVLGLSWRTCSQAKEIYEHSERYFKLLSNTYVFKVVSQPVESKILLYRAPYRRGLGLSNEATFSASVVVLRAMTETNISPLSVAFLHTAPADTTAQRAAFGCPVHFEQPQNILAYRTADLHLPTAKADTSINQFLVAKVAEATADLRVGESGLIAQVDTLIRHALPGGIPSIAKIGQQLNMSNRTFTRRLSAEGVTFRELIQRTQESLARQLLRTTDQSMAEIAFQAEFSEQSAFSRAFVDVNDIAEVAVQALLHDEYDGQTLEVTGPRTLTSAEVVAEIALATGRNITYQAVSLGTYRVALQEAGLPKDYVWLLGYLFEEVLGNPANQTLSQDVQKVLGRPATDFSDYAKSIAATGLWHQPVGQPMQ